jgi:hypothetical protein
MNKSFDSPIVFIAGIIITIGLVASGKYFLEASKCNGTTITRRVSTAILPYRTNDGREFNASGLSSACRIDRGRGSCEPIPLSKDLNFNLPNRQGKETIITTFIPSPPSCWEE